jgi:murein DD-endopeptidase MepM/ murein hydrolase activator NlpD
MNMLISRGINSGIAHAAISALKKAYDPRNLKPGQEVTLLYQHPQDDEKNLRFLGVNIKIDPERDIRTTLNGDNEFVIKQIRKVLTTHAYRAGGVIETSLYESALKTGLSLNILMQLVQPFSFDVDFQRDIQPGDRFEIMYECDLDENGTVVREGPVLYATLTLRDNTLRIYSHTTLGGETEYFNEAGQTVRKTLMRTPINGARLSSRYGMRRHPILGYSRMHKGLDFAAEKGTSVMASGSGTVSYAGRRGNYGKYVLVRHANGYATAYAHLSGFSRGLRPGKQVKQGEVIGYVGSTGLSTGPHLHYEVHHRGAQINPSRVKFPPRRTLTGTERERFLATKSDLETKFAGLTGKTTTIARGN